ncbi:MAG: YwaF family protein [Clostridia bacterium]
MAYLLTSFFGCSLATVLIVLLKYKPNRIQWILRGVSIALAVVYFFRIFAYGEPFDNVEALKGMFGVVGNLFYVFLRVLTSISILSCLLVTFFDIKPLKNIVSFVTPLVALFNIIFFSANMQAIAGEFSYTNYLTYEFILETALIFGLSVYYLYQKIISKDFASFGRQLGYMSALIALFTIMVAPMSTLFNLLGPAGYVLKSFDFEHRLVLYFAFLAPLTLYMLFRKKDYQTRNFLVVSLAVSNFMLYFSTYDFAFSVERLPLHMCNLAVILMLIAMLFKVKKLFYFNYLVNVLGALCALAMPSVTTDAFSLGAMHFWYEHLYVFMLPLMGVALHIFPRPTFKMVRGAILVFTAYFLGMCIINPWFSNYGSVDYFFLNSEFLAEKFTFLISIKRLFTYTFEFWGLSFTVFPLYWLIIYVGYIVLMFVTWFAYTSLFRVADSWYDLYIRKRKAKADLLGIANASKINLKNSQPLNEEGKNMIKISHFTKIYSNNNFKSVDDFSLEINDGEVFGFLGHNGAGKSTLIKSLVGIQTITSGAIEICGYDIQKQPLPAKMLIGYVPDNHAVYERLTGREYINYVADLYQVSREDRQARLTKYLDLFKLTNDIDRQIKGYSHGMKQKVTVIAALIHNPKVWILDEPLTGLDPTSAWQIKECMRQHADEGNIVFFSSHVIEVVEKICNRIAIIKKGKLQCVHSIADLKQQNVSLEDMYLQYVEGAEEMKKPAEDINV